MIASSEVNQENDFSLYNSLHNVTAKRTYKSPGTPSRKAVAISERKQLSAKKVRAEKERLREQKRKNQERFLQRAAQRRQEVIKNSQLRKEILKKESDLAQVQKQKVISERQWALEQHRIWKEEQRLTKIKERKDEEARKAAIRKEQQEYERRERQDKERKMRADYDMKLAAREDVENYVRAEKQRRRDSLAMRLKLDSEFKKNVKKQKELEKIQMEEEAELERLALEDMERYIASEKEQRRQSLANFLLQESKYREKLEMKKLQELEIEEQERALAEEVHYDMLATKEKESISRRFSLVTKLTVESDQCLSLVQKEEKQLEEEEYRRYQEQEAWKQRVDEMFPNEHAYCESVNETSSDNFDRKFGVMQENGEEVIVKAPGKQSLSPLPLPPPPSPSDSTASAEIPEFCVPGTAVLPQDSQENNKTDVNSILFKDEVKPKLPKRPTVTIKSSKERAPTNDSEGIQEQTYPVWENDWQSSRRVHCCVLM